jgi:hypothetical protein
VNDRQRDLFLYLWSRRRAPGGTRIALRGAAVGALGGVAFALAMAQGGAHAPGEPDNTAGQISSFLQLLGLSVLAFGAIGFTSARRVWTQQERMYQSMLASGARVPDEKPVLQMADRGPMIAVVVTAVVIAGLIAALWWAANTGRL